MLKLLPSVHSICNSMWPFRIASWPLASIFLYNPSYYVKSVVRSGFATWQHCSALQSPTWGPQSTWQEKICRSVSALCSFEYKEWPTEGALGRLSGLLYSVYAIQWMSCQPCINAQWPHCDPVTWPDPDLLSWACTNHGQNKMSVLSVTEPKALATLPQPQLLSSNTNQEFSIMHK